MANGVGGENTLPARRHVVREQNQELVLALILLQLEVEAIVRVHRRTLLTATLQLVQVC